MTPELAVWKSATHFSWAAFIADEPLPVRVAPEEVAAAVETFLRSLP